MTAKGLKKLAYVGMVGFLLALATLNKMRELSLIVLVKILIMYKIIGIILQIFVNIRIGIISSTNGFKTEY